MLGSSLLRIDVSCFCFFGLRGLRISLCICFMCMGVVVCSILCFFGVSVVDRVCLLVL